MVGQGDASLGSPISQMLPSLLSLNGLLIDICLRVICQACIDQEDIAANLQALPVFLGGCQELVVLVGGSYGTRLWCLMELFCFLRMGGKQMRVYELGDGLKETLMNASATKAQCFLNKDRQRLLAAIEAGYGDCVAFDRSLRGLVSAGDKLDDARRQVV